MTTQLVICAIDGASWAFPIGVVREIIRAVPAQPVGSSDPTALGIVDLRGTAMPVYDMAATLGIAPAWRRSDDAAADTEQLASRRIVVTAMDERSAAVGWLVDGVDEVIDIGGVGVEPVDGASGRFVDGIAHVEPDRLVPVLAVDRLLLARTGDPDTLPRAA